MKSYEYELNMHCQKGMDFVSNQLEQSSKVKEKNDKQFIYPLVWRWHFYAGIVFTPFLIVLALSGAFYLFKPQIEANIYHHLYFVNHEGKTALATSEQISKVRERYKDYSITSVAFYDEPNRTTEVMMSKDGKNVSVFVNPHNGKIQGTLMEEDRFTVIFKKIHSELLIGGTLANRWVELTACWAVILLITGLYLWFPRNRASIWGTILPRLKQSGRTFWRDLHAVPAFWLSIFILTFIASGLPWSGVLGEQIQKFAVPPEYAYSFGEKPDSITYTKEIANDVPWTNEKLPVPNSSSSKYLTLGIDEIQQVAEQQKIEKPFTISFPENEKGVYTLSHSRVPKNQATLHIDQYNGAILSDVRFQEFGWGAKLVEIGIAFHEGRLFGLANQLLGFIVCAGLIGVALTSCIMWWKRKPQGKLGAPQPLNDKKKTRVVFFILLFLGILMPLVGLSILVVYLLDRFVLIKIKPLKTWLG